jgi:hypothetical protein
MWTLFQEGGLSMWLLVAFGAATLVAAGRFAWRPERRRLWGAVALGIATGSAAATGICSDLAAVGHHAPRFLQDHPGVALPEILLQGFAESMAPGILGFTMLSLGALLVALGLYRQADS